MNTKYKNKSRYNCKISIGFLNRMMLNSHNNMIKNNNIVGRRRYPTSDINNYNVMYFSICFNMIPVYFVHLVVLIE